MTKFFRNLSIYFTAGVVGAIIKILVVSIINNYHIYNIFGASQFAYYPFHSIFKVLIIGGLWGLGFFLPIKNITFLKGLFVGLLYSFFLLLYYYPYVLGKGIFATKYGHLAWVLIIIVHIIWGLVAELYTKLSSNN